MNTNCPPQPQKACPTFLPPDTEGVSHLSPQPQKACSQVSPQPKKACLTCPPPVTESVSHLSPHPENLCPTCHPSHKRRVLPVLLQTQKACPTSPPSHRRCVPPAPLATKGVSYLSPQPQKECPTCPPSHRRRVRCPCWPAQGRGQGRQRRRTCPSSSALSRPAPMQYSNNINRLMKLICPRVGDIPHRMVVCIAAISLVSLLPCMPLKAIFVLEKSKVSQDFLDLTDQSHFSCGQFLYVTKFIRS